jgi:hypothetical protein
MKMKNWKHIGRSTQSLVSCAVCDHTIYDNLSFI